MLSDEDWIVIIISIILIIALIVYFIFLVWAKRNNKWIFAPYVQPKLPNSYPLNGTVVELTAAKQETRRKLIEAALSQNKGLEAQSQFDLIDSN